MHKAELERDDRTPSHGGSGPRIARGVTGGWAGVQGRPANRPPPRSEVHGGRGGAARSIREAAPGPPAFPAAGWGRGRGPGCKAGEKGGGCGEPRRRRPCPARARITHPSPRGEAPVREAPHAVLPAPCGGGGRRRRRGRCGCDRAPGLPACGLRRRRAITLFHTRPAHSGNGRRGGQCACAWRRARSPALCPLRAPTRRALTAQAPGADNERGLCREGLPQAGPRSYCASAPPRPAGTMRRTPAWAGAAAAAATRADYTSQRAARQLWQGDVGRPGMLGFVVRAAFPTHSRLFGRIRAAFA